MEGENNMETVVKDATNGNNVISSIDMNIQRIVQNAMKKYMKKSNVWNLKTHYSLH